jgi:septal ring factor EnvC (AmiA/AmiB activator)
MDGAPPVRRPWMLIAAALVLLITLAYVLVGAYLPSRQRMAGLETELKDVYQKEAELQTQLAHALQKSTVLQQQVTALAAERDALLRRTRELEEELLRKRGGRRR